jgi:hypothetical protein
MILPPKEIRKFDFCGNKLFGGRRFHGRGLRNTDRLAYGATKLYVMTPETFTGWPESLVGENLAPRAADAAAARSSGWPLTAEAETTFPFSSIST